MIASSKKPDLSSLNHSGLYETARQKQTGAGGFPSESGGKSARESLDLLRKETAKKTLRRTPGWWSVRGSGSRMVDILVVLGFLFVFTIAASVIMILFR